MGAFNWNHGLAPAVLVGLFLLGCNSASTAGALEGQDATLEAEITIIPATIAASPTPTPAASPTSTATPSPTVPSSGPVVSIGSTEFTVEVAATGLERSQGLSGRPSLAPDAGMLFVFEGPGIYQFWMIDMQFPLDFVWISDDCVVVELMQDVPPPQPGQTPGDLPRYRPSAPVRYVLEVNAGEVEASGIQAGDPVVFGGELFGKYGC